MDGKLVEWVFDESRLSVFKSESHQVQLTQGDPIVKLVVSSLDTNGILVLGRKSAKFFSAVDRYQTTRALITAPSGEAFVSAEFVTETRVILQTNVTVSKSLAVQFVIEETKALIAYSSTTPSGAELACFRNHSSNIKFFVQMPEDVTSRLRKCVMSIAEDYSISVISFEEMSCIYLFGAYQHRLLSIQWRPPEDYVVLCYSEGVALVWQLQTGHLERTITGEAARELMEDTRWSQSRVVEERWLPSKKFIECSTDSIQGTGSDGIQSLLVNWRLILTNLATIHVPEATSTPPITTPQEPRGHGPPKRLDTIIGGIKHHHRSVSEQPRLPTRPLEGSQDADSPQVLSAKAQNDLNAAKALLGLLITGDDPHSLSIRTLFGLGKPRSNVSIGMRGVHGNYSMVFSTAGDFKEGWCISPTLTASRLIAIISLARSIATALRIDVDLDTWTRGYCDALPGHVGAKFCTPSLSFLAKYWQDPQPEIQEATKIIMLSTLRNMSKVELQHTVKYWAGYLPAAASPENCSTQVMARSAIILGILGADNPHALSERTRELVGLSLTLLLDEESRLTYKVAAIELIAQGFATWQPYLRAEAVLKTLFAIAIDPSPTNKFISLRARKAAGQIASINSTLFVSTLSREITEAKTIEDKTGYMKLISFFARKDPKVLYLGVQRLAEVIVKVLDPSSASVREALLPVGTSMLLDLVQGYPQIDFHVGTQKLAVGTLEGAIIIYDLQTATRWQILEGHTTPLSAVTFSRDGRTIVSCALQEGTVKIWHPNVGFFGMLLGGGHALWSATTATTTTTTTVAPGPAAGSGTAPTSSTARRPSMQGGSTHDATSGTAKTTSSTSSALSSQKSNKTFDFALQANGDHSGLDDPEVLLSQVRFEWTSDRVVKLTVLDHIMSFNI
ncbi:hypothetical protein BGW42_007309 [Actinomortierella wolfii]|nr:hypothetical protein BGW42_007309 [Actinomortierella wolfii]